MFSWRIQSSRIFDQIVTNSANDLSEESDTDDEENVRLQTNTDRIFKEKEPLTKKLSDEEIEEKLKRWVDLTNIEMGPYARDSDELKPNNDGNEDSTVSVLGKITGHSAGIEQHDVDPVDPCDQIQSPVRQNFDAELTFKFQYLIISEKLKVTVVKATNLFKDTVNEREISAHAKVCLMPGKSEQKRTNTVCGSKSPTFDCVTFLEGHSLQEMHQMCLRIILFGRDTSDGQSLNLGEVTVCLEDFDITAENVLDELINTRICSNPGGKGSLRIRLIR